jgi:hypothetical protein
MLTVAEEKALQDLLGEDEESFSRAKLNLRDFASEECEKIKSDVWFPLLIGQMVGSKQYKQMPESIRSH